MRKNQLILIYGISGFTGALPFLFAPIVSKILSVEEFGLYNILHSSVYFLLPILTIGYQTGLRAKLSMNPLIFPHTFKKWGSLIAIQSIVISIVFCITNELDLIEFSVKDFVFVLGAAIPIAILSFLTVYWELLERFVTISLIKFVSTLSIYTLLLLFLQLDLGYYSRVLSQIIVYSIVCLFLASIIFNEKKPNTQALPTHRELLEVGWPLTLISFLELFVLNLDKWMILTFMGDYELGLYSAYFYFYIGLVFLANPLGAVIETYIFKNRKEANNLRLFLYAFIFIIVLIVSLLNSQFVQLLFGEDYLRHSFLISVFALAGFFKVLISDRIRQLIYIDRQKYAAFLYMILTIFFAGIIYLAAKWGNFEQISFAILGYNCVIFLSLTLIYFRFKDNSVEHRFKFE